MKSSDIEMQFQRNPTSSYTFNVGAESVEIRFRGKVLKNAANMENGVRENKEAEIKLSLLWFARDATGGKKQEEEGYSSTAFPAEADGSVVSLDFVDWVVLVVWRTSIHLT